MIIYNITVSIDDEVHEKWLSWMKTIHIPNVMATGYFSDNKLLRLINEEEGGITYAVQYTCKSMEQLASYQKHCAPKLQQEYSDLFKGRYAAFRTFLKVVHQHKNT